MKVRRLLPLLAAALLIAAVAPFAVISNAESSTPNAADNVWKIPKATYKTIVVGGEFGQGLNPVEVFIHDDSGSRFQLSIQSGQTMFIHFEEGLTIGTERAKVTVRKGQHNAAGVFTWGLTASGFMKFPQQ